MKKVGIEKTLKNVKRYLENRDCSVELLNESNKESQGTLNSFDAIVVSGSDSNLMGIQDIATGTEIIDASGKTENEIYNEVLRASEMKKDKGGFH